MPRLIFVNRFFFPDQSATSQILSDLAFYLASGGRDVHVVASRQNYDNPEAALPSEAIVNNVHVHRVASTRLAAAPCSAARSIMRRSTGRFAGD